MKAGYMIIFSFFGKKKGKEKEKQKKSIPSV